MKYQIKVVYKTGDSFNIYQTSDIVGYSCSTKEEAEELIKVIQEHNSFVLDYWESSKNIQVFVKDYLNKSWYNTCYIYLDGSTEEKDLYFSLTSLKFNKTLIDAFWCGYFEKLISLEILED